MKKMTVTRVTAGAAVGSALLLFGGAAAANAESGDGRVDLAIGSAGVLTSVPIETATQIAAGVCDSDASTISSAAQSVDASGSQQSVCNNEIGAVDFRQNTASVEDGSGAITSPGAADAEGASFSEEPVTETEVPAPAPDEATGDEEPAVTEGAETPVVPTTTTTVPAPIG